MLIFKVSKSLSKLKSWPHPPSTSRYISGFEEWENKAVLYKSLLIPLQLCIKSIELWVESHILVEPELDVVMTLVRNICLMPYGST